MGRNYETPNLSVWENEELDVIRTSIGDASNRDAGGDDIAWTGAWNA